MQTFVCLAFLVALGAALQFHQPACVARGTCMQQDFKIRSRVTDEQMTIAIRTHTDNDELAKETLHVTADPSSKFYTNWMTHEEVTALALNKERVATVTNYFTNAGVHVTEKLWWVELKGSAATFEKIFDTQIYHYVSKKDNRTIFRAKRATVPKEIESHVRWVEGLTNFPSIYNKGFPAKKMTDAEVENYLKRQSSGNADINLLRSFYGVPSAQVGSKATQAVFEALGQSYDPSDLEHFEAKYNIPNQPIAKLVGPNSPQSCQNPNNCAEASLDVQYIIAVSPGAPTTFWSIDPNINDVFYTWITEMLADPNAPLVTSISYGGYESEEDQTRLQAFETDMVTLGNRGCSLFVSSGDDGVAGFQARNNPSACGYNPSWPATSVYATAVGATQGPEVGQTEVVCSSSTGGLITSGGGFSGVFNAPSFQSAAIAAFFQNSPPNVTGYNPTGRGYPDLAMLGHNYVVRIGGQYYILSGTSCSSPVTAAMVSQVNSIRQANGKKPLGYLNPAIYANGGIFNTISSGQNNCCAAQQDPVCCQQGFTAYNGWSPIVGFGSINFPKFSATFSKL